MSTFWLLSSTSLAHGLLDGLGGLVGLSLGQDGEVEDAVGPLRVEPLVDVGGEAEKPGVREQAAVEVAAVRNEGQKRGVLETYSPVHPFPGSHPAFCHLQYSTFRTASKDESLGMRLHS